MLELAERIIDAYKTKGLVTGFIFGKYANGKTSYLLHTGREVFGNLYKLKNVDAWLMSLDNLFFDPIESILKIETERAKHPNERLVMIGMDDVGQHIPRARWWREDVVQFREWMTVARTDVASVLFTAPTQLSLPGGIVDCCFLRLRVKKHPTKRNVSIALGYEVSVTPYFQTIVSGPVFEDEFPRHYPQFVFDEYQRMRDDAVSPLRRRLIGLLGDERAMKDMSEMGASHKTIGNILGKDRSTVSKHLRKDEL